MALNFTEKQIKSMSLEVLNGPKIIKEADRKVKGALAIKQGFLEDDQKNEVFTNHRKEIVEAYHEELKLLSGEEKTNYDPAEIDKAGRLASDSKHFPNNWQFFNPKVLDSNNGQPVNTLSISESVPVNNLLDFIELLVNGFSDGSAHEIATEAESNNQIGVDDITGFSVNDRIYMQDGSSETFAVIDSLDQPGSLSSFSSNYVISFTPIFDTGQLGIGAEIQNFHPGFPNSQRTSPTTSGYLGYIMSEIDLSADNWLNYLIGIETALNNNDSREELSQNQNELLLVTSKIDFLNNWSASSSRFADPQIGDLDQLANERLIEIPNRTSEVISSLGSVNQDLNDQGKISGSGQYFLFFKDLVARIHFSDGSLRSFYSSDQVINFAEQARDSVIEELERLKDVIKVKTLVQSPSGGRSVFLSNVSELQTGDPVMLVDNQRPVLKYFVSSVDTANLTIELDGETPTNYSVAQQARLVKVL